MDTTKPSIEQILAEKKEKAATPWGWKDEANFINGMGTHTGLVSMDLATLEQRLNGYRLALCKRASHGKPAGFSIADALKLVDKRLSEVRAIREHTGELAA